MGGVLPPLYLMVDPCRCPTLEGGMERGRKSEGREEEGMMREEVYDVRVFFHFLARNAMPEVQK